MSKHSSTGAEACPCGSGKRLSDCCLPYLQGVRQAPTAEALMLSRYTAYCRNDSAYLQQTWHPDWLPQPFNPDTDIRWIGLKILTVEEAVENARVEFEAGLLVDGWVDFLHERSEFACINGVWLYTQGEMLSPSKARYQPAKNAPCPCGSGRKFKRCCGE